MLDGCFGAPESDPKYWDFSKTGKNENVIRKK
jgi:hypothetical protein